jgi:hypothetical protein
MLTVISYTDPYVSLVPGAPSFFGNRSFVIHYANTTRYACANFIAPERFLGGGHFGGFGGNGGRNTRSADHSGRHSGSFPTGTWGDSLPTDFPDFGGGFGRPSVSSLTANGGNNAIGLSLVSSEAGWTETVTATVTLSVEGPITTILQAVTISPMVTDAPSWTSLTPLNTEASVETDSDLPPLPQTVTAAGFNAEASKNATETGLGTKQLSSATYTPAQVTTNAASKSSVSLAEYLAGYLAGAGMGLVFLL